MDNSDVVILNFFYDGPIPYSAVDWGLVGNNKLPVIIDDGIFEQNGFDSLFFEPSGSGDPGVPIYIFIDSELKLYFKQRGFMTENDIDDKITEMLSEF